MGLKRIQVVLKGDYSTDKDIINKDLQLIQDSTNQALTPLQAMPMVGGVLLSDLTLTAAQDNIITHGLGHIPTLFLIGNLNVSTTVWSTASTTSTITLRCSTSCSAALWIN